MTRAFSEHMTQILVTPPYNYEATWTQNHSETALSKYRARKQMLLFEAVST